MHIINFISDQTTKTCVVSSNRDGLQCLIDMIQMKLKMGDRSIETLICKDFRGEEFKLRFDLLDND